MEALVREHLQDALAVGVESLMLDALQCTGFAYPPLKHLLTP